MFTRSYSLFLRDSPNLVLEHTHTRARVRAHTHNNNNNNNDNNKKMKKKKKKNYFISIEPFHFRHAQLR